MTDLREAGRRLRDEPVAEPSDLPALEMRARAIRRRRRLFVAVPSVAAIIVAAVVVARPSGTPRQQVDVGTPAAVQSVPPPATNPDEPYLWLSSTDVPATGAHLAAVVVNPTSRALAYGLVGVFQRWTGKAWVADANWYPGVAGQGFGTITTKDYGDPEVAVVTSPHGLGGPDYFSTPSLAPGWYRIGYVAQSPRPAAFGVIRVSPHAPVPAPVGNPVGAYLTASPSVLPPSGGTVRTSANPGACVDTACRRFYAGIGTSIDLQRWSGGAWHEVASLHRRPMRPASPGDETVVVPAEPDGTYRLIRSSPRGGDLTGAVWVAKLGLGR